MTREQIIAVPLQQIDGEKEGAVRMPCTLIIGHVGSIAAPYIRRNAFGYCALRMLRGEIFPENSRVECVST